MTEEKSYIRTFYMTVLINYSIIFSWDRQEGMSDSVGCKKPDKGENW